MATRTISRTWKVEGVLTNVTSAKLSDSTGTFGVKRNDTDAVVVADDASMTSNTTGVYTYSFDDIAGVAYTAYVEIVYAGATYYFEVDLPARTTSTTALTISYVDISEEIGDFLGLGRSGWATLDQTRVDSIIKSGLRQVYYPQEFRPGMSHQWSWMRPEAEIVTTAAYSTGTIEVVLGEVTVDNGGTFPTWADEGELHVGGQIYSVNTRDDSLTLTLNDLTVSVTPGTTYSLARPSYELPEGFDGSFDGDLHYKTGDNTLWPAIRIIAPTMIRMKKQTYNESDRPLYAAIQPKAFNATVGQRWEVTFFPAPSSVWTFYGRYKVRPVMIDDTELYPLGGTAMAEVFLESCLAVAEKRFVEDSTIHQEEFNRILLQAINNDADAFSPDYLGYNSDRSESSGLRGFRHHDSAIHSYNGVVYRD